MRASLLYRTKLVPLYHACGSFPCKNLLLHRYYIIKKVHRFTFSWQICYKFKNTESREVEKWVKQLQKKYLMLT